MVALVVALAACGGDDDEDAGPATTTTTARPACVLTGADVSALVGIGFADPTATPDASGVQCIYEAQEDGEAGLVIVRHGFEDAEGEQRIYLEVTPDEVQVELGDAAWWSASTGTLFARDGEEHVEVLFSSFLHQPDLPAVAVALGGEVLAA